MKRMISALLALILVLGLCGCSGNKSVSGTVTPRETEPEKTGSTETAPAETEAASDALVDGEVSLGEMQGGVYTNAYAGFGCELDERWSFKTAEELQDLSQLTDDMLRDSTFADSEYSTITDMMAENYDLLTSINVNYTRLSVSDRVTFSTLSEEALIDATLLQKDNMIQSYALSGIQVSSMEKTQVSFLGEQHYAIHTVATIEDTPYYLIQLFCFNLGGQYNVTLTLASFVEDNTASLLELFYPV